MPARLSSGTAGKLSTRVSGKLPSQVKGKAPHYQNQNQIDRKKYSFVRASSAPVVITSKSVFHKTQNVCSRNSAITGIQPSTSTSREATIKNPSPKTTPKASSTLDLKKHSLESLRKILAAKMEAKAGRKVKAPLKQSDSLGQHPASRPINNKSHDSLTTTPNVTKEKQNSVISHHTSVKITGTLKSGNNSKNVVTISDQKLNHSQLQISKKKSFHPKCSSQKSTGLSNISSETGEAKTGDVSVRLSQGNSTIHLQNSAESFSNLAGQLPSKVELAEGLKNTEAKIKELTAELTKLKEVAKIVSVSPTKNSHKARKPNSSSSSHGLRRTSSNSSYIKAAHKKYGQSNTQHAARYVVSKYKLKKVHLRTSFEMKYKPKGKVDYFKKTVHTLHPESTERHKQPHKPSTYKWSRPGKLFPRTSWRTLSQSSHLFTHSGNYHQKRTYMYTGMYLFIVPYQHVDIFTPFFANVCLLTN